jgi:hypothetical protein
MAKKSIMSTAGEVLAEAAKAGYEGARLVAVQAAGTAARAATETILEQGRNRPRSGADEKPKGRRRKGRGRKAKKATKATSRKTSARRGPSRRASARGGGKRVAKRRGR